MEVVDSGKKLTGIFKYPALSVADWEKHFDLMPNKYTSVRKVVASNYLFGIEMEVERVRGFDFHSPLYHWSITEDGSLRHDGREFVSHPMKLSRVEAALQEIKARLPQGREFTRRTSVHVHMNVRDMGVPQIFNLVLLYMVFEKSIFRWIGNDRHKNIFCLPIYECGIGPALTDIFGKDIRYIRDTWSKYTGMNLLPITDRGTIEFRHMYGTDDVDVLLHWINMLACMKIAATNMTNKQLVGEIYELNTSSNYRNFCSSVFGEYGNVFLEHPDYEKEVAFCTSAVKRYLLREQARNLYKTTNNLFTATDVQAHVRLTDEEIARAITATTRPLGMTADEVRRAADAVRNGQPRPVRRTLTNLPPEAQRWAAEFQMPEPIPMPLEATLTNTGWVVGDEGVRDVAVTELVNRHVR